MDRWAAVTARILFAEFGAENFTRQDALQLCLPDIITETGSIGRTPAQTFSRILQNLRDSSLLHFYGRGLYMFYEDPMPALTDNLRWQGERVVKSVLLFLELPFVREKRFADLRDRGYLPFDFYLPNHNLLIEFDGAQHAAPVEHFGGEAAYALRVRHDKQKTRYARRRRIDLLRFTRADFTEILADLRDFLAWRDGDWCLPV